MNYMKEILCEIKIRPGMFLGNRKLENLHAFMNGYIYQMFQEDIVPEFITVDTARSAVLIKVRE